MGIRKVGRSRGHLEDAHQEMKNGGDEGAKIQAASPGPLLLAVVTRGRRNLRLFVSTEGIITALTPYSWGELIPVRVCSTAFGSEEVLREGQLVGIRLTWRYLCYRGDAHSGLPLFLSG